MSAASGTASAARHLSGVGMRTVLIAAIVGLVALIVSAGSGSGGQIPGIGIANARGNGHITVPDGVFAGTTTATLNPGGSTSWGFARCYQSGTLVYTQYVRGDSSNQAMFTLGPTPNWTGGSANCVAQEGYWSNGRWRVLAETDFLARG
jgi:hypothetical protein